MALQFAVTYDYRCPFARIVHEHLVTGLRAGATWDVGFWPFSLDQSHVADGGTPVWDEPDHQPGLLANLASVVVRDRHRDQFLDVHQALFEARHAEARDTRKREVVADVLTQHGVDADGVLAEVEAGWPLEVFRKEHTIAADDLAVFGVPTFIADGKAAFVRLLDRPTGPDDAVATIERIVDQLTGWPSLNEFKHTTLDR